MKTITITLSVPDDVTVAVQQGTPAPVPQSAPQPSYYAPIGGATTSETWPAGACPIHGAERWKDSKYGGHYCTAKDDSQDKGYCTLKSGVIYNGKRIPA